MRSRAGNRRLLRFTLPNVTNHSVRKSGFFMFWIVIALWVILMAGFVPVQLVHIFSEVN